jgi:hypothetical protein
MDLSQPKYKDLQQGNGGGTPVLKAIWDKFDFSLWLIVSTPLLFPSDHETLLSESFSCQFLYSQRFVLRIFNTLHILFTHYAITAATKCSI